MNEQQQSSASSAEDQQQITKEQINQFIQDQYAQKGSFDWKAATAAGIAALVWSRFPTLTREDVLNKLTTTASGYPTKNKSYGWGKLNADAATD